MATLAYDGIAVIVSPENTVEDLTLQQIAAIYTGEITNWSQVGGIDAEIVCIGREAGSGTRGGFEEIVGVEDLCKYRQELTSTGDVITAAMKMITDMERIGDQAEDIVDLVPKMEARPDESTPGSGRWQRRRSRW